MRSLKARAMAMQKLTTKNPPDMAEVAIAAAVEAVFDWKEAYPAGKLSGYITREEENRTGGK